MNSDLSCRFELLPFISDSFWVMWHVRGSSRSSWFWIRLARGPCVIVRVGSPAVSDILKCTPCNARWSDCVIGGLLFGRLDFSVHYNNVWIHFGLGSLGATGWSLEPTKSFLAGLAGAYLMLLVTPALAPLRTLVFPALREEELSPWEFI